MAGGPGVAWALGWVWETTRFLAVSSVAAVTRPVSPGPAGHQLGHRLSFKGPRRESLLAEALLFLG